MGILLPFNVAEKRRARPPRAGEAEGKVVLFTGVRFERMADEPPPGKPRRGKRRTARAGAKAAPDDLSGR